MHPVGIGLSSWFFERFVRAWSGPVYVPDLIGCGDSDAWDPDEQGLFVPLDWVRMLEQLWREAIGRPMVVVSQGGLAPVAVRLATRETEQWQGGRAVRGLVLASPPEYDVLSAGLDEAEVMLNYERLSWALGADSGLNAVLYRLLCARFFIRLFSDLFLFAADADNAFLDNCVREATLESAYS